MQKDGRLKGHVHVNPTTKVIHLNNNSFQLIYHTSSHNVNMQHIFVITLSLRAEQ